MAMKWLMNKKMRFSKNQKGLTLVELLAVIVILGVIAAIAVPSIGGIISSSKTNADAATVELLKETAERYMTDTSPNGNTTTTSVTVAALVGASYLKTAPMKQSASTSTAYVSIAISYSSSGGWTAGAVT
jgi:type IV pilus assembly protein PilA